METAIDSFQGYTFHFEWEVAAQEWLQSLIVIGFVAPFLVGLSRVMLGGATLYFGLNALFKYICELIFSEEFLASASFASFAIITVRYAIIMFLIIGVYPLAFDRIGTPKATIS